MVVNFNDRNAAKYLIEMHFEDYEYFRLADSLLSEGDVHIDVGANYGFHTFGLLREPLISGLKCILIDANEDCVNCLQASKHLYENSKIDIILTAVGEKDAIISFSYEESTTGPGHVENGTPACDKLTSVKQQRLDQILQKRGILRVALIKTDIEGSEFVAFQGLLGHLRESLIDHLYFEVNPKCLIDRNSSPTDLFDELERFGYRLFWPHDSVPWIAKTFGVPIEAITHETRLIGGAKSYPVIEFDRRLYDPQNFGQCDLLAISPTISDAITAKPTL